ncbi:C40 family peptidase [Cronobacter sakazakii]|nr:C40 family peptidase [Cronobacter sakazakii]ELY3795227.1 C40 family peptidase [Cronobacter sakazakii]ELY3827030.1 C40 family peptidase [Cronobacter sakazakii]ELY4143831.1 C40 family peptidase [Cronobacter sakazakii]
MRFLLMILFYCTSLLAAPAFSAVLPASWHYHDADNDYSWHLTETAPPHPLLKRALLNRYISWKGTRYHFGGTTHHGVDCSALMQHLFAESVSVSLPRTTSQQLKKGTAVRKTALQPGDLVFFSTGPQQRHVGVYIGDNQFIHASKEKGVTISSLTNEYWRARYLAARRVV